MASTTPPSRSATLADYQIIDTLPEQIYTDIVRLASQICGTSMSMINFLPDDRQWTKAQIGLALANLPLEQSFCVHAIERPEEVMVVPDTANDARFRANPLVTGDPHLRFYAGAALVLPSGQSIGAVCVLDTRPHQLTDAQTEALQALARQVVALLELRRTVRTLHASEERFRAFMDNSPALAFLKDTAGRYQYVNRAFLERFALTAPAIIGYDDTALWPSDVATAFQISDQRVLTTGRTEIQEEVVPTPDGQFRTLQVYKFPLPVGQATWLGGMALDITVQRQYAQYLEAIQQHLEGTVQDLTLTSRTDALTGIANRRAFDADLVTHVLSAAQTLQPLAVVLVDVDHFKSYNDTYGHQAGDGVLQQIAQTLQIAARGSDLVARYGGEEFVLLLPNTTAEQAQWVVERCRLAIETAPWPARPLTISCGIAAATGAVIDPALLLAAADTALYQAKRQGRNQVVVASF